MKITIAVLAILISAILFGGIALLIGGDIWSTTSEKQPATYNSGDNEGTYNPADIRGSYTFAEVSDLFKIDLNVLYNAFNIAEGTDGTQIQTKDMETVYGAETGIGNESVQVFVALYKGLPIDLGDTILPEAAVNILLEKGNLTEEEETYILAHSVAIDETAATNSATASQQNDAEPSQPKESSNESDAKESDGTEEEQLVKGSTTFQQVLDAGITKQQIEAIIGSELPQTNQTVKDYCNAVGLTFSEIKDQLNALVE